MRFPFLHSACAILCGISLAHAETPGVARVTQAIKDVTLRAAPAARSKPAAINQNVADGTLVRTGVASRAEITFNDQTVVRMGANTDLRVNVGARNLELASGAVLLRASGRAAGAQITTDEVTAALAGTTCLLDYHKNAYLKYIVLEGVGRIFKPGRLGESVLVRAGQMLIMKPDDPLPDPVDIDLQRLTQTSVFFSKDFRPLTGMATGEIDAQHREKSKGALIDTNLVIFGTGTSVQIVNPTPVPAASAAPKSRPSERTATAEPLPSPTPPPPASPEAQPL